jgi:hypothetical protein
MKKLIITLSITVILIASAAIFYSCEKEEKTSQSTENVSTADPIQQKGWWSALVKFVKSMVTVSVNVSFEYKDGLYYAEYYENGNLKHEECKEPADKVCVLKGNAGGSIGAIGHGDEGSNWDGDYTMDCILGIDKDGNIILAADWNADPEACDHFFFSDKTEITCPYTIDNPSILNQLNIDTPIIIRGIYSVYNYSDGEDIIKYIILKTAQ